MSISLVLTRVPETLDGLKAYLTDLSSQDNICEVLIAANANMSLEEFPPGSIGEIKDSTLIDVRFFVADRTKAELLNWAVSESACERIMILDHPYNLASLKVEEIEDYLDKNSRGVIRLNARVISGFFDVEEINNIAPLLSERVVDPSSDSFVLNRRFFLEIRGFDESSTYDDCFLRDFLARCSRLPFDVLSKDDYGAVVRSDAAHELNLTSPSPSRNIDEIDVEVNSNRAIFRNLADWSVSNDRRVPLISVAIATKNRPNLLRESIRSVLYQSFQDFEITVVDDGSDEQNENEAVILEMDDARIRYIKLNESHGVATARNIAADSTSCLLTAVHDDDDLMLPWRLEVGIAPLSDEVDATYGAWVNFDDKTAEMRVFLTKSGFSRELIQYSNQTPGHSTWTIYTDVVRSLRYDETLSSAVDHNLAVRTLRAGLRWLHTESALYLRRVHDIQITAQDGGRQKAAAYLTRLGNRFLVSEEHYDELSESGRALRYPLIAERNDLFGHFGGYLPDHLVERTLVVTSRVTDSLMPLSVSDRAVSMLEDRDIATGKPRAISAVVEGVTQGDLVEFRKKSFNNWSLRVTKKGGSTPSATIMSGESAADTEAIALIRSRNRVREEVNERLKIVRTQLTSKFPNGRLLLVVYRDFVPSLICPPGVEESVMQRRIYSAGEFGVSFALLAFGFENSIKSAQSARIISNVEAEATVIIDSAVPFGDLMTGPEQYTGIEAGI